jgi:hypothetical protein
MKFQVGDIVKCVDGSGDARLRSGEFYEVSCVLDGAHIRVSWDKDSFWFVGRFELSYRPIGVCAAPFVDSGWLGPTDWPVEHKTPEPFKIDGLGRYRCRDGISATLDEYDGTNPMGPWYGKRDGESRRRGWCSDGDAMQLGTNCDIISRVTENPPEKMPRQWWIVVDASSVVLASARCQEVIECVNVVETSVLRKIADIAKTPCNCCRRSKNQFKSIQDICREVLGDDAS